MLINQRERRHTEIQVAHVDDVLSVDGRPVDLAGAIGRGVALLNPEEVWSSCLDRCKATA